MSILIKNGTIYDGSGQPSYKKDILIRGELISKIGNISSKSAEKVIDAEGAVVMPGFIDVNSDSDHHLSIISDPSQESFIRQGITTTIGGNEGISLAPVYNESALDFFEDRGVGKADLFNIGWREFDDFLNTIKKRGIGVNFGSLVGYSTARKSIDSKGNPLDNRDKKTLAKILNKSLEEGAFGVSTGFEEFYSNSIKANEVIEVINQIDSKDFIYVSSIRDPEENPLKSVKEILKISKKTGLKTQISHIQPNKSESEEYKKTGDLIEEKSKNINLDFDCHPTLYRKIPLFKLLPEKIRKGKNLSEILNTIKDDKNKEDLIEYLKTKTRKKIRIIHADRGFKFYEGKFIKDIANNMSMTQAETLLKLMKVFSLKAVCLYGDVNDKVLNSFLKSNSSIVTSDGLHLDNEDITPFIDFIKKNKELNLMPMEKGISKITSKPAIKFNIRNRGYIKEKYYADIVVMKNSDITDVLVNGDFIIKNNEFLKNYNGKILRRNA